jgi:hypothetical protein
VLINITAQRLARPSFPQPRPLVVTLWAVSGVDQRGKWCYCEDVFPSGLCYPHSALFDRKGADRKKITSRGQVRFLIKSYITLPKAHVTIFSSAPFARSHPRVLGHDVSSSTILLWNDGHIVLADISLCLPTSGSAPWLREPRGTVTILGHLERQSQVGCIFPFAGASKEKKRL